MAFFTVDGFLIFKYDHRIDIQLSAIIRGWNKRGATLFLSFHLASLSMQFEGNHD